MPFKVEFMGLNYPLIEKSFDYTKKAYGFSCDAIEPDIVQIPYVLKIDDSYDIENFIVFIFVKKDLNENDIYQVYDRVRDTRIGWCFPIRAMDSNDHSYADNEHFLKYSFVTFRYLIKKLPKAKFLKIPSVENTNLIHFSQFFSENAVAITISKSTLIDANSFNIDDYLPSLFYYGFFPLKKKDPEFITYTGIHLESKRLYIRHVSESINNKSFIFTIFSEVIAYESNAVFLFFYLYQIIETLMETIFQTEQVKIVHELNSCLRNPTKIKEVFERINSNTSEKRRLVLLMSEYITSSPDERDLKTACNNFLNEFGFDSGQNLSEYLYRVRNFIFHQFWNFRKEKMFMLEEIVKYLAPLICELLISFDNQNSGNRQQNC